MKFFVSLVAVLSMASVAKADIMWRLADIAIITTGAIPAEKVVKSNTTPLDAGAGLAAAGVMSVGGVAGYNMAMTRYQANEILNTAAMLSILAMSGNSGQGKDMTLAEAGLPQEICNVDMKATKEGVVTIVFGEDCQTKDGKAVHMKAVREQVRETSGHRVLDCSENKCVIDMTKSVK